MTDTSATRHVPSQIPPVDTAPPASGPVTPAPAPANPLRRTRTGSTWVGIMLFAVMLVLLLIFILQNTQSVDVSYFGLTGHVSLAVAMLLAAIAASLRIWQLRRHLRRSARQ